MELRKWTAEEKMAIILEGLRGQKSIFEIYRSYQISQTFFTDGGVVFFEAGQKGLTNGMGAGESKAW